MFCRGTLDIVFKWSLYINKHFRSATSDQLLQDYMVPSSNYPSWNSGQPRYEQHDGHLHIYYSNGQEMMIPQQIYNPIQTRREKHEGHVHIYHGNGQETIIPDWTMNRVPNNPTSQCSSNRCVVSNNNYL